MGSGGVGSPEAEEAAAQFGHGLEFGVLEEFYIGDEVVSAVQQSPNLAGVQLEGGDHRLPVLEPTVRWADVEDEAVEVQPAPHVVLVQAEAAGVQDVGLRCVPRGAGSRNRAAVQPRCRGCNNQRKLLHACSNFCIHCGLPWSAQSAAAAAAAVQAARAVARLGMPMGRPGRGLF